MNILLFLASILAIIVGLVHSILGEFVIFNKLRKGSIIPSLAAGPLRERNIRILWATWHIASILGWLGGIMLINIAAKDLSDAGVFVQYIAISMCLAGSLVFVATRARHPGWIGLWGVAILCWLA